MTIQAENHSTRAPVGPGRVCVVGVGAMGGLVAAKLLQAGVKVTLVDQGARLEQLRRDGLSLRAPEGETITHREVHAVPLEQAGGEYDLVVLAVKTYDLSGIAPSLPALIGPETVVLTLQNGIPWWYFHRFAGPLEGRSLRSVDPDESLRRHIDPDRIIGCIPYPAAELLGDGVVKHVEGHKLPVGELDGRNSARVRRVAAILEAGGFKARVLDDVRSETWLKAWGNLAFNPISALTGATLEDICRYEPTRRLAAEMMREAQVVAERLGASFRASIDQRIQGAEAVGPHKTSMLQDLEAGRTLETEALVGAVVELAELVDVDTPAIRSILAAVRLLERTRSGGSPVVDSPSSAAPAIEPRVLATIPGAS